MKKLETLKKQLFYSLFSVTLILGAMNLKANSLVSTKTTIPHSSENFSNFATGNSGWTLDATVNNVECYYKIATCNGSTTVFLKFNNKNAGNVKITWEESFQTQSENGLPGTLGKKELILLPGFSADNDCSNVNPLTIIQSFQIAPAYPSVIKSFNFIKVNVSTI